MRLLHVVGSMNPRAGGPCQGIRTLAGQMTREGHSVEAVCMDEPHADFVGESALRIHALGRGRWGWNYHPALGAWLNQNLPRFDAVILNGLWQYQGYALLQASRRHAGPGYVVFPHGMLDPWFQRANERRLKSIRNWFYWKLVEQHVIGNAAALFFTCAEEMRLARDTFHPYRPVREVSVGYGVARPPKPDPAMQAAFLEKCPGLNGKPYLLYLSRIHPKKGVDLLIQAYAEVCRSHGRLALPKLVIAGPGGETAYGQRMRALADELCPAHSVFWPGMLTGNAKWGGLHRCEAFILPSHQENFGIAVVEALACGRPVLISDQINIWREIEGDGAALVQPDSVEGAGRLLLDWLSLPTTARNRMITQTKACFQRRFSIEVVARKLQSAIACALNPK